MVLYVLMLSCLFEFGFIHTDVFLFGRGWCCTYWCCPVWSRLVLYVLMLSCLVEVGVVHTGVVLFGQGWFYMS